MTLKDKRTELPQTKITKFMQLLDCKTTTTLI